MEWFGTVSVSVFQGFGEGVKEVAFSDIEEAIRAFDRIDPQKMPRIVRGGKTLIGHDVEAGFDLMFFDEDVARCYARVMGWPSTPS